MTDNTKQRLYLLEEAFHDTLKVLQETAPTAWQDELKGIGMARSRKAMDCPIGKQDAGGKVVLKRRASDGSLEMELVDAPDNGSYDALGWKGPGEDPARGYKPGSYRDLQEKNRDLQASVEKWERTWERACGVADRALEKANSRFQRIQELERELAKARNTKWSNELALTRAELRRMQEGYRCLQAERDELLERVERAEKRLEKQWWPNGRPTKDRIDSLMNPSDGSETATESKSDPRLTEEQKQKWGPSAVSDPGYQEAQRKENETLRRAVDTLADHAPKETLLCVGGPLDGYWHTDSASRLMLHSPLDQYHKYSIQVRAGGEGVVGNVWASCRLDADAIAKRVADYISGVKSTDRTPARPGVAS